MATKTAPTNSDLSTHVGKAVRFAAGTRKLEVNITAGSACLGVLVRVYTLGATQYGEYSDGGLGVSQVMMGKSLAAGTKLSVAADGTFTDISSTEVNVAVLQTAGVLGSLAQAQMFDTSTATGGGAFSSSGTLTASIADGATLTAAAAASMIPAANLITLPANFFPAAAVGSTPHGLVIDASGKISSVITTPGTARFDVRFNGTVIFDGLAILLDTVAAHVNVGWKLRIELFLRSVGAGVLATFFGIGEWTCEDLLGVPATAPKGVLSAILPWNSAPAVSAGWDSTIANAVDVQFTQTVASGSLTCNTYRVSAF